jgi:hypothetical protein
LKNFIILLGITISMLAIAGIMPSYWLLKYQAKNKALKQIAVIHEDALTPIHANQIDKAAWENEHELSYHQVQYDVVSIAITGKDTVYYCYADQEESRLNNKLKSALAEQIQRNVPFKNQTKQLICQLQELFFSDVTPLHLPAKISTTYYQYLHISNPIRDRFLNTTDRPPIV